MNIKKSKKRIRQKIQRAKLYLPGSDDPIAEVEGEIKRVVDIIDISKRLSLNSLDAWEGKLWILQEYQSIRQVILKNREFRLQLEDDRSGKIIIEHPPIKSGEKKIGPISFQGSGPLE